MENNTPSYDFNSLIEILNTLLGPNGCPWDRVQTPDSLKENLIEEAYECFDAIIENDYEHACEELGDVFLLAAFISIIYEKQNRFGMNDVFKSICEKLIRRHPHIFSDKQAGTPEEVKQQWDDIKLNVEGRIHHDSVMDSLAKHFPPLLKAYKIQKKAAKNNFEWDTIDDVIVKLDEEVDELKQAVQKNSDENIEEEIGDILFTIINISRYLKVDPSTALSKTNSKFLERFRYIESEVKSQNKKMSEMSLEHLDKLWDEAKLKQTANDKDQSN